MSKVQKKNNNKIIPIKLDLSNESQIKDADSTILSSKKSIDILINNAATIHSSLFQMTSKKNLTDIFEVNFFSQTVFTQYILKSMM